MLAVRICTNPPSKSMTYGYQRITILAALFNAVALIGIAVFIGGEADHRILDPQPVQGAILFATATIGVIINLYIGLGMRGEADNINIRSAMLHVLGDAAASGRPAIRTDVSSKIWVAALPVTKKVEVLCAQS